MTEASKGRESGETEVEVRRSVWRLLARELSEPSEEFVSFICARLDAPPAPAEPATVDDLARRALQEFAGHRWATGDRQGPRPSSRGRQRSIEHGALPGYYLG